MTSNPNSRERILLAATRLAQARGYGGLNFRDLADSVGIKAASIYHHFPSKAVLAADVAKRYWEDSLAELVKISSSSTPLSSLRAYPDTFRRALVNDNRICLCSFMAAEYDDLPAPVKKEVNAFADVNVTWLKTTVAAAYDMNSQAAEARALAIFAAISGAQLIARTRSDVSLYDAIIDSYRSSGLLPENNPQA